MRHMPELLFARPVRGHDLRIETNVGCDAVFIGRVFNIFPDGRAVCDRLGFGPGFEIVSQRVHVTVRTDARIAEQVPCPANCAALLEDLIAQTGAFLSQMNRCANAGETGPDDQNVRIGVCHDCFLPVFQPIRPKNDAGVTEFLTLAGGDPTEGA